MYKYTIGGKDGQTFELRESQDLVVVRTRGTKSLEESDLSASARNLLPQMTQVAAIPEANVAVYKCLPEKARDRKKLRDTIRAKLKKEKSVRFAGRVLEDKVSGNIFIYTENFFVKFKDDISKTRCREILNKYKLKVKDELKFAKNAYFTQSKEGTGFEIFEIAETLLKQPEAEYCHPELVQERRARFVHPQQWHLIKTTIKGKVIDQHVDVKEAWKVSRGMDIVIAVIDDGVDTAHEEFVGKIVAPHDTLLNTNDARPKYASERHGTPCAGVACAAGKQQAAGVAPEAKLMPIRSGNLGSISEAKAFAWAAENGADIISCSWGPPDGSWWNPNDPQHRIYAPLFDSTRLAIDYAIEKGRDGKGCVITWAAGNGNEEVTFDGYASYDKVIAVAACNDQGKRSVYSDYGPAIWCAFPSNDFEFPSFGHPRPLTDGIWTTDRGGAAGYNPGGNGTPLSIGDTKGHYTATFGGTSSACPGVAGVAALVLAINPALTWIQVRDILKAACERIDTEGGGYNDEGHSIYYGFGRLNARLAVALAKQTISLYPDVDVQGMATFTAYGEVAFDDQLGAGGFKSGNKLLGLRMSIHPLHPQLGIRYRVAFNRMNKVYESADGSYAGVADKRRKAIGISIALTGDLALKYKVRYATRTAKGGKWQEAENGMWSGKSKGAGAAIREIRVEILPV